MAVWRWSCLTLLASSAACIWEPNPAFEMITGESTTAESTTSATMATDTGDTGTETGGQLVPCTLVVDPMGDDDAAGTVDAPLATIQAGVLRLEAGDTLCVREGTYFASVSEFSSTGLDWDLPLRIVAFDGETPRLEPIDAVTPLLRFDLAGAVPVHHVELRGFFIDAQALTGAPPIVIGADAHHIRIAEMRIVNAPGDGLEIQGSDNVVSECSFENIFESGVALTEDAQRNTVEGCLFRSIGANGVHAYRSPQTVAHANTVIGSTTGIRLHGDRSFAFNNVVIDSERGMLVANGLNVRIFNNTLSGCQAHAAFVNDPSPNAEFRNNLLLNCPDVVAETDSFISSNNEHVTADAFIDAEGGDYHLVAGSPAVDAGASLPDVPTDKDGVTRPQGAAYDIGAYESVP